MTNLEAVNTNEAVNALQGEIHALQEEKKQVQKENWVVKANVDKVERMLAALMVLPRVETERIGRRKMGMGRKREGMNGVVRTMMTRLATVGAMVMVVTGRAKMKAG